MSNYIENFVKGYGINFEPSRRNKDAFDKAMVKWEAISSDLKISKDSIVMLCGAKSNGKSSLLRYLANKYLEGGHEDLQDIDSECNDSTTNVKSVYLVDFDPGQCEISTPGTVSAHLIKSSDRPLVHTTYLNLHNYEEIVVSSVGGTNMSVNPKMYMDNCRYVMERVREHRSDREKVEPMFINTMGHIRNVGLDILIDLIKIVSPTDLIVLNVNGDPMRTIYADLSPQTIQNVRASFYYETHEDAKKQLVYRYHLHNLEFAFTESDSIAKRNRTALQLSHLALIPDAIYKPIMQITPKSISLDNVSIHCVSSYPLKVGIVLELLYHSWVHLVKLRKNFRSIQSEGTKDSSIWTIIDEAGENRMFGCGIVTNVDIGTKTLSIITPLNEEELKANVNCIIKPLSVQVPREVLQND